MNIKINNISRILFLILLFSCKDNTISKDKFYSELDYKLVNIDTLERSLLKSYYPTGELRQVMNIQNDLLNGKLINYYKSGNIKSEIFVLDGVVKDEKYFFKNKALKTYLVRNKFDKVRYKREYDSLNNLISIQGKPIIELVIDSNNLETKLQQGNVSNLKILDTIEFLYTVAVPPNTKVNFKLIEGGRKVLDFEVKKPYIKFLKILKGQRKYNFEGIVELQDFKKNKIIYDTLFTTVHTTTHQAKPQQKGSKVGTLR